jgi:high affinity sulfate transporter 1
MAAQTAPAGFLGRLPILGGIAPYDKAWLSKDIVAGITLAALAIPETMGYTKLAGMPVITGLYTILIPIAAFALFGSSRHLVVGADSATAVIMYAGIAAVGISGLEPASPEWVSLAGLSAIMAGGLLFIARVLRLGFLANFLSRTVLIGFLTGVGIQVAIGQVGGMLGIPGQTVSVNVVSGDLAKFFKTLGHIGDASWQTALVSAGVLAILIVFERFRVPIPGGLVAVVGMIALSWIFDFSSHDISTLGHVPSGLPHIGAPKGLDWGDAMKLFATAASMFLVILAQSAATSRAYAVKYNERFEENRDLIGLGLANISAGFSGTFVVNGSPTKTEMVDEAKSHTQVAQLSTAVVVAIVLLFLTKPLQYMPNAVLSAVVFLIGLKLIDIKHMREIYAVRRDEFVVALVTTVVVVTIGVEQGIILAIVLSLVLHVRRHYIPADFVLALDPEGAVRTLEPEPGAVSEPGLIVYRFGAGIFYANAARLSDEVIGLVTVAEPPRAFVFDLGSVDDVDYTGGHTLLELVEQLADRGIEVSIAGANDKVRHELDVFGITAKVGADHVYQQDMDAVRAFRGET